MSRITNCPRCQADLSSAHFGERGLVCPHCQNPLADASLGGLAAPEVETDVAHRRSRGLLVLFVVLAVLILLDVGGTLLILADKPPKRGLNDLGHRSILMILFVLLDALVITAVLIPLSQRILRSATYRRIGEIGRGFLLFFLFVAVPIAICIVFYAACVGMVSLKG